MSAGRTLLLRADSSAVIGSGHVMRCLALAQAWRDAGGEAVFATALDLGPLTDRFEAEAIKVVRLAVAPGAVADACSTCELARDCGAAWVVADGYVFGYDYQEALRGAGLKLLFVDDNGHAGRYCADLVLNQNIHADESFYEQRAGHTRLLLGPRYSLLRREFWGWIGRRREVARRASKILVTLGGGDADNVTAKAIDAIALAEIPNVQARVAVGGRNRHLPALRERAADAGERIRIECDVMDMSEPMTWADLALAAGGSTSWELALTGLPAVGVALADNQVANCHGLAAAGSAVYLGWHEDCSPEIIARELTDLADSPLRRERISARAQKLVDGRGGERVVAEMTGH